MLGFKQASSYSFSWKLFYDIELQALIIYVGGKTKTFADLSLFLLPKIPGCDFNVKIERDCVHFV